MSLGDLNADGVLDLVSSGSGNRIEVRLGQGGGNFGASTVYTSVGAINRGIGIGDLNGDGVLDKTLQNLAKQRGSIGASQSRVNIAIQNLQTTKENFAAAESRIRDVDIAEETSALVRTQILQKAATSVLAQANQQPALALQLLD